MANGNPWKMEKKTNTKIFPEIKKIKVFKITYWKSILSAWEIYQKWPCHLWSYYLCFIINFPYSDYWYDFCLLLNTDTKIGSRSGSRKQTLKISKIGFQDWFIHILGLDSEQTAEHFANVTGMLGNPWHAVAFTINEWNYHLWLTMMMYL